MSFDLTQLDKEMSAWVTAKADEFDKREFLGKSKDGSVTIKYIKPGVYRQCEIPEVTAENKAAVQQAICEAADDARDEYKKGHDEFKKLVQDYLITKVMEIGSQLVQKPSPDAKLSDEVEDKLNFVKRLTKKETEDN